MLVWPTPISDDRQSNIFLLQKLPRQLFQLVSNRDKMAVPRRTNGYCSKLAPKSASFFSLQHLITMT